MATVQFFKDYDWNNTPKGLATGLNKQMVIERLAQLRVDWEEVFSQDGFSLLDAKGSIGLLLSDICDLLEFKQEERLNVLGSTLTDQIDEMLDSRNTILVMEGESDN